MAEPASAASAASAVNSHLARERPASVARRLEAFAPDQAAGILTAFAETDVAPVWERISPDLARDILGELPGKTVRRLLESLSPTALVNLLAPMEPEERDARLALLGAAARKEVAALLSYPEGSAGRAMDPRFTALRPEETVEAALVRLRRGKGAQAVYLVDAERRLVGRVPLDQLAFAPGETALETLAGPVSLTVSAVEPMEAVVEAFADDAVTDIPVVDVEGRLVGHFQENRLTALVQRDATADLQTMVGASRDERALSPVSFAVRKRIGWLQINLLTAFLAASVVGLFEDTIARVTALAVLLPVVAGQSGNAGAQALAVTMRGLALREITLRHWWRVTAKEAAAGLLNGVGVAATCGIGVFLWSGSMGLVLVIMLSMVLAMIAAGLAGALVPIVLVRFGQDPAVASSIVLTTVTDVAGFFAFLGIATALMGLL